MEDQDKNNNEQFNNSQSSGIDNDRYFLPQNDELLGLEIPEDEISLAASELEKSLSGFNFHDDNSIGSTSTFQTRYNNSDLQNGESISEYGFPEADLDESGKTEYSRYNSNNSLNYDENDYSDPSLRSSTKINLHNSDLAPKKVDMNAFTKTQAPNGAENYTPSRKSSAVTSNSQRNKKKGAKL